MLGPKEFVDLETALRGVITNPAKQGLDDNAESLEIRRIAHMVVLSQGPRKVDPLRLDTLGIEQTWFQGQLVYDASV